MQHGLTPDREASALSSLHTLLAYLPFFFRIPTMLPRPSVMLSHNVPLPLLVQPCALKFHSHSASCVHLEFFGTSQLLLCASLPSLLGNPF